MRMQDNSKHTNEGLGVSERYIYYALSTALCLALTVGTGSLLLSVFPQIEELNFLSTRKISNQTIILNYSIAAFLILNLLAIRRGYITQVIGVACVVGIGAIWLAATFDGRGFFDPVYVFVFVIQIVTAAYLGQRSLIIASGVAAVAVLAAYFVDNSIYTPNPDLPPPSLSNLLIYLVAIGMSTLFLQVTVIRLINQAKTLNAQTQELEISQEALRNYQVHLEDVVEARTFQLSESKARAEAANMAKSVFLTNMSHELRTPLNAIIGYSEIIAEESEVVEMEDYFLEDATRIGAAGKHLLGLINSLLDLSKIESDQLDFYFSAINLDQLLEEIEAISRPVIERNNNMLLIDIKERPDKFVSDEARVRQILLNLIGNAAKFTTKGLITLEISLGHERIYLAVTDTGIGIKPDFLPSIFDQFSQADVSRTRKYGGSGLGLAITKQLCNLLGGDIKATSEVGVGSTFKVELPLGVEESKLEDVESSLPSFTENS